MKPSPSVLLYTLSLLMASGTKQGFSTLVCLYDSMKTVVCTWSQMRNATDAQCRLTGSVPRWCTFCDPSKALQSTCQLHGAVNRSCELIFDDQKYSLTASDYINLVVFCRTGKNGEDVQMETQKFIPFQNIQLKPPFDIKLENTSTSSSNITWKLWEHSHYINMLLKYEVRYKNDPGKAGTTLPIVQDQKWIKLENLSPDTMYEAVVRVKTQEESPYNSTWSNWSTPLSWRTDPKVIPETTSQSILIRVFTALIGSSILITVVLVANTKTSKWLRRWLKIHLPEPAEFFPSLTAANGDVQRWLSSRFSMASFHVIATSPDVSALEIIQKGKQEPCLLLSKEYFTPMDAVDTSGNSSSSCVTNRGYFFFHHLDSLEVEPCKVYFSYDASSQLTSDSEDGDSGSYKLLHTPDDHLPLPSYGMIGKEENGSFLPEVTQKVGVCSDAVLSAESFLTASAVEQDEEQNGIEAIVLSSESPNQPVPEFSSIPKDSGSNTNETEVTRTVASHTTSMEGTRLSSMFLNPGQASDLCRAVSSSHISSSEAYLSLRELQSHYSHYSV
ncbi:interleukin-2 receptor subunit beta [Hemicordylus capensis]|uniref:interleukin-2 receptor subunit beta n=1 Tax=Hemicordylus capensis TaxID=884348 RepID=UPI00230468D5|nr:interleukin-2 receptor subunit beta [Hemicordylus capensis]